MANPFTSSPSNDSHTDSDVDSFHSNEANRDSFDGKDGDGLLPGLLMFESSQFKKDHFDPDKFIVDLTRDIIADTDEQKSRRTFDPLPLQHKFDEALNGLRHLAEQTDEEIAELTTAMKKEEVSHQESVKDFESSLSHIFSIFRSLDKRISQVVHTAVRTGDRLELVENRKKQTEKGKELIQHFLRCNAEQSFLDSKSQEQEVVGVTNRTPSPEEGLSLNDMMMPAGSNRRSKKDAVFRIRDADGRVLNDAELGKVLRSLEKISIDVHMKEAATARDVVSKRSDEFQKRLLSDYVQAVKSENRRKCKEIAHILSDFESRDCIEFHVNHICESISNVHAAPRLGNVSFRQDFTQFYAHIRSTWNTQALHLAEIFPVRAGVFELLLRGIFGNNILPYINKGLEAYRSNTESYLETLDTIYSNTRNLVRDFQETIANLPHKEYSSSSVDLDLTVIMDNSLIIEYRKGYSEKELEWLKDRVKAEIERTLARYDEQKELEEAQMMQAAAAAGAPPPTKGKKKQKATSNAISPNKGRGFAKWKRSKADKTEQQGWLRSILQDDLVVKLIAVSKVSLLRCNTISDPNELASNVSRLFVMMLKDLNTEYFKPILEASESLLPEPDSKSQPDLFFLQVVRYLNDAILPLQTHFTDDVAPLMSSSNAQSESAKADKNLIFSAIEENFAEGLRRCLEAAVNYSARILSNEQKKADFKPRDDNVLPDQLSDECSKACASVTDYIKRIHELASVNLAGRNLDTFVTVFGLRFHKTLMDHLYKYTVTSSGTLLLMRDTKAYQDCFREFHIRELSSQFDALRHLVNLLAVPPRDIQTLRSRDNTLSKLDADEIKRFLQLRADYKSAKIERLFKMG